MDSGRTSWSWSLVVSRDARVLAGYIYDGSVANPWDGGEVVQIVSGTTRHSVAFVLSSCSPQSVLADMQRALCSFSDLIFASTISALFATKALLEIIDVLW